MRDIKVVFMGTPDFAVPILDSLIKNTNVVLVVSQPDKKVGRKQEIVSTPVKKVAEENGIEVFQPNKIREDYERIISLKPDLIVTCAYGQIIPKAILDCPRLGCINVHASLLPKLRGGAPIHHAIIDDYKETGITIMYMDERMDSGDIISQERIVIEEDAMLGVLHDKLSIIGAKLLINTLPSIIDGTNDRISQDLSEVTYGYNITREEEHLDFNGLVKDIYNQVRGLNPWPLANMMIDNQEIKVIECNYKEKVVEDVSRVVEITKDAIGITASDGIIYVTKIKPFGKGIMATRDYLNGVKKENLIGKLVE